MSATQGCRSDARQHPRRHHRHPKGDKERERTEPGRNTHVHPVHLPDRDDPGYGGEPERRRQRGVPKLHRVPHLTYDSTGSGATKAAFWRSRALAAPLRQLSAMDSDTGSGKMSSSPFSTPSKIARATDSAAAFGISRPRDISVSTGPVNTACTLTPRSAKRARNDCERENAAAFEIE